MFEVSDTIPWYFLLDHIDGSSTLGGSHTTTYERRTSTETTTKISATSAFATTIEDTTEEQSVQGICDYSI